MGEMLGWAPDDDVIRRTTHAAARRAAAGRRDAGRFAAAPGVVELQVDAGKVPTTGGWRDVKVAAFARREPGVPTPAADCPGATTAADATVLDDGAGWIWDLAEVILPRAEGVLDVFHAVEHIGDATKAVWADAAAATPRREAGVAALLAGGKPGVDRWIAGLFAELPEGCDGEPLRALSAYLASHPSRLGDADRPSRGRSIGSGMVEGAIKQLFNRRMKRAGARRRAEHVGPLVELIALVDQPEWHHLWAA